MLFNVHEKHTRSHAYLLLGSTSHTTAEWRYLAASEPAAHWKMIAARRQDHEYDVEHTGNQFLIRTNDKGRNFRLVSAPVSDPGEKNWKELVPQRANVMLSGVDAFKDFYVLIERE